MKKVLSILLAAVLLLSACGTATNDSGVGNGNADSGANTDTGTQKVVAWAWDAAFNGAALQIAEQLYQEEHPEFELELVDMSKIDLEQKLNTVLASGVTEELPDIILVNDINAEKYVTAYPGTFADLTDAVDFSQFADYKVEAITVDDKIYGIPFDIGVTGMFYRRDYLEAAGFTEEDLQDLTWSEYIEIGKVVKEKTGKYMTTINPNEEILISIMLQSAGSWYITEDNKGNFVDNPVMIEALEVYRAISDAGIAKPVTGWSEFVGSFNAGDVATVISGIWQISSIMEAEDQHGQWGVAPIPRLEIEGAVNASSEGGSSWFVLEESENRDLAIDFLASTIGSDIEFYERFLTENGGVGSYIPAFSSETFSQPVDFFGGQAIYADFAEWMEEVPGISLGMYTQEARDALKNELTNILTGADLETSLQTVQQLFEQQVQ